MNTALRVLLGIGGTVVVIAGIGLTIEWLRVRSTRNWAEAIGGTFEAGGFLDGAEVPEAAPFDGTPRPSGVTYNNVVRVARGGVSYVVAKYHRSSSSRSGKSSSTSYVVVLVTLPGADFPAVQVAPPFEPSEWMKEMMGKVGIREPPRVDVRDSVAGFGAAFEVQASTPDGVPEPDAVARLLPRATQQELVRASELLVTLQARGDTVRLQSVGRLTSQPYEEMLALAERLVVTWRR